MTDSRRKGATGERELAAAILDTLGVRLVRQLDQCRAAGGFDLAPLPDDDSAGAVLLRGYAVEVKRYRAVTAASVALWWRQALRQADAAGLAPLLAYRADRAPWHVVVALDSLVPGAAPADGPSHTATLTLEGFAATAHTRAPTGPRLAGGPTRAARSTEAADPLPTDTDTPCTPTP